MSLEPFPLYKGLEKHLRLLDQEGRKVSDLAIEVRQLITSWENRYIKLGAEYIAAGGYNPELLNKIWMITKTREILGIFK